MAYELIAFDMDGTILNSQKEVLPSTVEAIGEAVSAGKIVAISSGRCPVMVKKYRDVLPDVRYAVCCAGATVYDLAKDRTLSEEAMDPEFVAKAIRTANEEGEYMLEVMSGGGTLMEEREIRRSARYGVGIYEQLYRDSSELVDDVRALVLSTNPSVPKMCFHFADPAARDRTRERLEGQGAFLCNCESSTLELTRAGVDKGTGLAALGRTLGLDLADIIAVGDAENDVSMLRAAGLGVAMGNANAQAAAAANVQVADCDHGGCAEAIRTYLLA